MPDIESGVKGNRRDKSVLVQLSCFLWLFCVVYLFAIKKPTKEAGWLAGFLQVTGGANGIDRGGIPQTAFYLQSLSVWNMFTVSRKKEKQSTT